MIDVVDMGTYWVSDPQGGRLAFTPSQCRQFVIYQPTDLWGGDLWVYYLTPDGWWVHEYECRQDKRAPKEFHREKIDPIEVAVDLFNLGGELPPQLAEWLPIVSDRMALSRWDREQLGDYDCDDNDGCVEEKGNEEGDDKIDQKDAPPSPVAKLTIEPKEAIPAQLKAEPSSANLGIVERLRRLRPKARTQIALVEFMEGQVSASMLEIARCVHDDEATSESAMRQNLSRTNEALEELESSFCFRVGGGKVYKDVSPS